MRAHSRSAGAASPIWINTLLALVALVWLLPYAWMLSTSFKTLPEIVRAPTAPLPSGLSLEAYSAVLESMPLARYFWNTTVMALAISALQIAVALPAGYALAKLNFKGRGLAFGLVVATLLIPAQVRFVPVFSMLAKMGLVNTMAGLVLPFGVSAFGTFLVRQALLSVPETLAPRSSSMLSASGPGPSPTGNIRPERTASQAGPQLTSG